MAAPEVVVRVRGLPVSSSAPTRDGSIAGAIMPGRAALFLDEMNALDVDAALGRLDHVVDRQARDRHRGQRLHLDAGRSGDLDACPYDAAGQFFIRRDVERDL